MSNNTLHQYPQSTSQLSLNWHPDRQKVDTQTTLDQQQANNQPSVNQLICIYHKLVDSQPNIDQDDGVSMECQPRCQWSVDRILMECWSHIDQEYWSTLNHSCKHDPLCIALNKNHDYNYHVPARVKNTASYFLPWQLRIILRTLWKRPHHIYKQLTCSKLLTFDNSNTKPKSPILHNPSRPMKMFAGLISMWTISLSWRCFKPW